MRALHISWLVLALVFLFPFLQAHMTSSILFTMLSALTVLFIIPVWLLGFEASGNNVEDTE